MRFETEHQLYRVVIRAVEKLKQNPIFRSSIEGEMRCTERQSNGQRLYLVGETHYSRKPVDYVHKKTAPEIEQNPQTWLILREDADDIIKSPVEYPTHFYFQELVKLFKLPYEDALANLWSPNTREYIQRNARINEDDIDRFVLDIAMRGIITSKNINYPPRFVNQMSEILQKPAEYTSRLLSMGSLANLALEETIVRCWNDCSRERFHKLREKYSDKNNILVSVGYSHLPAFDG